MRHLSNDDEIKPSFTVGLQFKFRDDFKSRANEAKSYLGKHIELMAEINGKTKTGKMTIDE